MAPNVGHRECLHLLAVFILLSILPVLFFILEKPDITILFKKIHGGIKVALCDCFKVADMNFLIG